jgi:anti-anti-sigma factor
VTPPSRSFSCEVEVSGDTATVKCHGMILMDTAPELKQTVKPMIGQYRRIVLDLNDVGFLDSAGLGMLVSLKGAAASAEQCSLELTNLSPRLKELLETTKLSQLFNFK